MELITLSIPRSTNAKFTELSTSVTFHDYTITCTVAKNGALGSDGNESSILESLQLTAHTIATVQALPKPQEDKKEQIRNSGLL